MYIVAHRSRICSKAELLGLAVVFELFTLKMWQVICKTVHNCLMLTMMHRARKRHYDNVVSSFLNNLNWIGNKVTFLCNLWSQEKRERRVFFYFCEF